MYVCNKNNSLMMHIKKLFVLLIYYANQLLHRKKVIYLHVIDKKNMRSIINSSLQEINRRFFLN